MSKCLFQPAQLGDIKLENRIIMAPLTRGRAGNSRIPNDLMRTYYAQRASAGLIIAEATAISEQGYGWNGAPAMYNDAQEQGWKKVVDAVHRKGGKIVLQLWHMGRVVDPDLLNGKLPVAPSAIAAKGASRSGKRNYVTPHALTQDEMKQIVQDYAEGALRAKRAGFDGVEVHSANGYLLDQFVRDSANQRDDDYGGSAENRIRFPLEVVEALCDVFGAGRVGIRISPTNPFNGMSDSNPIKTFTAYAKALNDFKLSFLHIMEPSPKGSHPFANKKEPFVTPYIDAVYDGKLIVNGGYDRESAEDALSHHKAHAVAFGVPFIANPDLVERFKLGAPLNEPDQSTFYSGGAEGYIDYPFLDKVA